VPFDALKNIIAIIIMYVAMGTQEIHPLIYVVMEHQNRTNLIVTRFFLVIPGL
jgi:hypothetical protein